MNLSLILEIFGGWKGFSVNYKQIDCQPKKWFLRIALGLFALVIVWGDTASIRSYRK